MKYFNTKIKFLVVLLTIMSFVVPVFSYAEFSDTLKLLVQVRGIEQSSQNLLNANVGLREAIDSIYQNILESLTQELYLLQHPGTTSVIFDTIGDSLSKGAVTSISFSRVPIDSSTPLDFWIETGGHSVGGLSNQLVGNSFNWQVADNFLVGRKYYIVAKTSDGQVLGASNFFTVSDKVVASPSELPKVVSSPVNTETVTPAATTTTWTGPAPDINLGIIGFWSFDNNANRCDTKGGAVTNAEGKIGNALGLDGLNSYCVVSTSKTFYPSRFSIDLWAKSDAAHKDVWAGSDWFISLRDGAGYEIGPVGGTKKVKFTVLDSTDRLSNIYEVGTVEPSNISEWHNYAVTYDGSVASVYLDGQLATSTNLSIVRGYAAGSDLYFGSDNAQSYPQYGVGSLDEIRLYNRAVTPCEILVLAGKTCQGFTMDTSGNQVASVFSAINKILGGN
ncbi:MAG: LamG domain-containing protein [Candidatus Vogelbacteria bacterium]|nr:LamG domain-containing protein [Candidatus Vogelbacteria bacterium]